MPSIVKVVCSEYFTGFITDDNKYYHTGGSDIAGYAPVDSGLTNIVDGDGGQYASVVRSSTGNAYVVGYRQPNTQFITQIPITGVDKVTGLFNMYILLKNGTPYVYGEDILNINGRAYINTPIALNPLIGRTIVKIIGSGATAMPFPTAVELTALASDGTVWRYTNKIPVQISFPGNIATDITYVGPNAFVAITPTNMYAWGFRANYVGLPWNQYTPASIVSQYTGAGAALPFKQVIGNYNTLHVIDANDKLFGQGEAAQGEIGSGVGFDWLNNGQTYAWNFSLMMYRPVTQVVTPAINKWKNVCTGHFAFYFYAQDMNDNWYSWGRNKARSLGNGVTLNDALSSTYPNGLDMLSPSYVTPLTQTWTILNSFNPASPPPQVPQVAPIVTTTTTLTPPTTTTTTTAVPTTTTTTAAPLVLFATLCSNNRWYKAPATIPTTTTKLYELYTNNTYIKL